MNYEQIRSHTKQFVSLTSLTVSEFDTLLPLFSYQWERYINKKKLNGKPRLRKYSPRQQAALSTIAEKLFFIMVYLKHNNVQELQAAMFGLSQDMCNKWIHILTPLVKKSLEEYGASRNQAALQKQLEEHHTYLIDATERPIERPIHDQESYYSGKKKAHTIKNLLLATLCGYILFIGTTVEGKKHDKRIADEQLSFDKSVTCLGDLGFQGFDKHNVQVLLPHKKPRNQALSEQQKAENTAHSRRRTPIENNIGSVKILRIVKDKNRNRKFNYRDTVMDIAVSLHNYKQIKRGKTKLNILKSA